MNQPAYRGAQILLSGENFGCGSSREHAVWALAEFGVRAIIAASFNPIFNGNCVRNGIAPIVASLTELDALARVVERDPQRNKVCIDLAAQSVTCADTIEFAFAFEPEAKTMLLNGYDAIDLTMTRLDAIRAYRARDRLLRP